MLTICARLCAASRNTAMASNRKLFRLAPKVGAELLHSLLQWDSWDAACQLKLLILWWALSDLNGRPFGCKPNALTAELSAQPILLHRTGSGAKRQRGGAR